MRVVDFSICPVCERRAVWGVTHAGCLAKWRLDGLISLLAYEEPLKKMIQEFKYKPWVKDLQKTLISLMIKNLRLNTLMIRIIRVEKPVVTAVPLHKSRIRERGYNQAEILGRVVAEEFGLDFRPDFLVRWRKTKPQVGLKGKERRGNVKGAFKINSKIKIQKSKIILIDDVWTTGATMRECGRVLKRAGAGKVWALTLSR